MPTVTVEAIYEGGVLRPCKKLPLREGALVTLIVQLTNPVSRTHGMFRVPKRLAEVLIYADEADFYGA